jgi:hypothetical protein
VSPRKIAEPDIFGGEPAGDDGGGEGEFAVVPPTGRRCKFEGCDQPIPDGSHPARKYCEEHFVGKSGNAKKRTERAPKLVVDLGGAKKTGKTDQRAADTAAGALAFANVIATGFAMGSDDVCATAVVNGAPAWAQSVGELSKYQPWLASFFAPVGGESQLGAWLAFLMTTGAIALPVMAHHGILPESIGAKLGGVFVAAEQTVPADDTRVA